MPLQSGGVGVGSRAGYRLATTLSSPWTRVSPSPDAPAPICRHVDAGFAASTFPATSCSDIIDAVRDASGLRRDPLEIRQNFFAGRYPRPHLHNRPTPCPWTKPWGADGACLVSEWGACLVSEWGG